MQCEASFPTHSSANEKSARDKSSRPARRDAAIAKTLESVNEAEKEGRRCMNGIAMAVLLEAAVAACVYGLWHAFLLIR